MTDLDADQPGDCPDCNGSGESSPGWDCSTCGGSGDPTYCGDCGHIVRDCTCDDGEEEL